MKLQEIQENAENGKRYGVDIQTYMVEDGKYAVDINGKTFSNYLTLQELDETVQGIVGTLAYVSPSSEKTGSWVNLAIDEKNREEFLGELIDQIEDMLAEYNSTDLKLVELPRTEKAKESDLDIGRDVVIAGDDYDELHDRFRNLIEGWGKKTNSSADSPVSAHDDSDKIFCILHLYDQNDFTEPHYYSAAKDGLGEVVAYARSRIEAEEYLKANVSANYGEPDEDDGSYYEIVCVPILNDFIEGSSLPDSMAYYSPVSKAQDEGKISHPHAPKKDDMAALQKAFYAFWDLVDLMADNMPDDGGDDDPEVLEMVKEAQRRFQKDKDDFQSAYDMLSGKEDAGKRDMYVSWKVEGRFHVHVKASSVEEARELATEEYENADFGELEDIGDGDTYDVTVEDENGNFLWER